MGSAETSPLVARRLPAALACVAWVAAGLVCSSRYGSSYSNDGAASLVFVTGGQVSPLRPGQQGHPLAVASGRPLLKGVSAPLEEESQHSLLMGFCSSALVASVVALTCQRVLGVAMRSQGQGGRGNYGQFFMPTIKGGRKMVLYRPRKNYGSHQARRLPRRYPLYDKLEEYDTTLPIYTVVSEPEEPLRPVEDVGLMKRYPWAGELKVGRANVKCRKEDNKYTRMEPYFANYVHEAPPPQGQEQLWVKRRGWPSYDMPPWINKPLVGTAPNIPKTEWFRSYRKPKAWQYPKKMRGKMFPEEYDENGEPLYDEDGDEYEDEEEEGLDEVLDEPEPEKKK